MYGCEGNGTVIHLVEIFKAMIVWPDLFKINSKLPKNPDEEIRENFSKAYKEKNMKRRTKNMLVIQDRGAL